MSDYAFIHEGKAFTPNGTDVPAADAPSHNAELERLELERWATAPDRQLAYFAFPAESNTVLGVPRSYRASFSPTLYTYINKTKADDPGTANHAHVTTWTGKRLGTIVSARVYTHNFGGRFVSLTVKGTNGALYHGRASWDNGTCIWLRKSKESK